MRGVNHKVCLKTVSSQREQIPYWNLKINKTLSLLLGVQRYNLTHIMLPPCSISSGNT